MPKLNAVELLSLISAPNITDIDLKPLQELYLNYLLPYKFIFELTDGTLVKLKFDRERFCHLIGLDKVPKELYKQRFRGWDSKRVSEYKGFRGWDKILDGTYDLAHMQRLAARLTNGLGDAERKLVNFYYVPKLMRSGNIVIKYVHPCPPGTTVNCELFIYDIHSNLYLQIGMNQDSKYYDGSYYPETFLVNRAVDVLAKHLLTHE